MTNKPMLSVERELIQRIADHCKFWVDHPYLEAIADVEVELRALLDKPVVEGEVERLERRCKNAELALKVQTENCEALKAAQHQGEPVAWRYKKSWEKTGWKVCDKHPTDYGIDDECYEIQALYAKQPAPVADHTQCEECKGWGYHENHHEGGGTECGECGGSGNATVAEVMVMVMPDRMKVEPFTTIDRGSKNYKAGYNAALAEVARLNEVKP